MDESPSIARVTLRRLLIAVLLISAGLAITRGTLTVTLMYDITPFESLNGFLFLAAIAGAGAACGLGIGQFFKARKAFAVLGAIVWPLLLAAVGGPYVFELLRLDRFGWMSHQAVQSREAVYRLACHGHDLAVENKVVPRMGIATFLQQLQEEGILDSKGTGDRRLARGQDGWGQELVVEVDNDILCVRSKGRDGIDQKGAGDDIEARVDYTDIEPPTVSPDIPQRRKLFNW